MEQKTKQKMSTKKKASAVVAGVLVAALALGGAYAWTDYSQNARNTFKGTVAADVLLHDDFNGENKDVYVENTGESEVFVRVKFAEYLQIGNNSVLTAYTDGEDGTSTNKKADPDDVTTWAVHQFTDDEAENKGCGLDSHKYFKWNMSGALKAYLSGVTESNSNGYGGLSEEAFNALEKDEDVILGDITTQKKESLPASPVMMLSDWLAADKKPTDPCWLLDTDGWAYWSAALQPGTATNLLLDSVESTDLAPYDNWVYHIDVQLQAATITELDAWYVDGRAEIANPDNSVATTTIAGYGFIMSVIDVTYTADDLVQDADGVNHVALGHNLYQEVELASTNVYVPVEGSIVTGGHDRDITTADDNMMLSGRNTTWGGEIEIAEINPTTLTYTIRGNEKVDDLVVMSGVDKKLGTYDDVITSKSGALGKYEIDSTIAGDENVGWIYLGGPIDNMLVATEYVLDNVVFNNASGDGHEYANSLLKTKIETIGASMNVAPGVVNTSTISMKNSTNANQVFICTKTDHSLTDHTTGGNCTFASSKYYTTNTNEATITGVQFFALSIDEIIAAYGDNTVASSDSKYKRVLAAPAYVRATDNSGTGNWHDSNSKDGNGDTIIVTTYWLRSPGYESGRGAYMDCVGGVCVNVAVTATTIGARPACYLNLSTSTTTP